MRESIRVPDQWKEKGVWYFPDVDENQKTWRRYKTLRDTKTRELRPHEIDELLSLEPLIGDLFKVRLGPYSHLEYSQVSKKIALKNVGKKQIEDVDAISMGDAIAIEICKTRIFEVVNYKATRIFVDEAGEAILDEATGEPRSESWFPKTGEELVDYISKEAGEEEVPVLEDIFKAIRNRSHLDLGQKKTWPLSPSSSPIAT